MEKLGCGDNLEFTVLLNLNLERERMWLDYYYYFLLHWYYFRY